MYTVESSLTGASGATLSAWLLAIAKRAPLDAAQIGYWYSTCCQAAGLDLNLALAQACDECDWFSHVRWTQNRNPAGIGITGDAVAGVDFGSIERGVKAHVALLCCFALPETPAEVRAWGVLESFGFGGFQRDRPRLADLEGAWETAPGYAATIAAIANQVTGGVTVGDVLGSVIVAAAMKHLGDVHETDTWNGDHLVGGMCEADVEDWYTEGGVAVVHYPTAAAAGDAAPLNAGYAPAGAQGFLRGSGWSSDDHTFLSLGGGRSISGLSTVMVSDGWQDLPSYRGWRFPPGVVVDPVDVLTVRYADGNPYGQFGMVHPFSSRWFQLDGTGLALPMMGWPVAAEMTTPTGRRIQRFERGWFGVQSAPAPWDMVELLPAEWPK